MANSSLGIYIDEGIIKYAKLQRDKDNVKVEAFNVVFYDDLEREINKIISETGSSKTPICVNLSHEIYNYFEVVSLMQKKDRAQSIKIDFETLCDEKGYHANELETRYLLTESTENPDKLVALHVAAEKTEISKIAKIFAGKKIESIRPITTSVINLLDLNEKENVIIVNLEEDTKVTTIIEGMIKKIDVLSTGMKDVLKAINETENSMRKSYDVLKNTTIYTNGTTDDDDAEGNEHLEEIVPVLYNIVQELKNIIDSSADIIHKVYITGLGSAINNIDLYFQEFAVNVKCEILKPFFLETTSLNTSFKDYIEVNSAIALGLDGIGFGAIEDEFNFKKGSSISFDAKSFLNKGPELSLKMDGPLENSEKVMIRIIVVLIMAIGAYLFITNSIIDKIADMKKEVESNTASVTSQINKANADVKKVQAQADYYAQLAELLKNLEEQNEEMMKSIPRIAPRSIPNLLKSLSNVVPKNLMILSIKNTTDRHVVIEVVAPSYSQIGYFKALISTQSILTNVKSSSGEKVEGYGSGSLQTDIEKWVYVTIEGDLQDIGGDTE